MRQDTIFRDAAHHFLRQFDKTVADFEKNATDADLVALGRPWLADPFWMRRQAALDAVNYKGYWDGGTSRLQSLDLSASREIAKLPGGPLQLGGPATPQCPRQPLMGGRRLTGKVKAAPFLYGAWPSLAAVRYAEVPERSLHGAMAPIEKLARKAITAATSLLVADLAIYQIIALSLKSDHTLQKLYSVVVPDRRGHTKWSGLLIGDVQGKQAAVAGADDLPGVKQHSMQVVGHLDIDHDGKLELVVNSGGENLDRYSVREYDGTMLNVVSYWHSCGD